MYACVFSAAVAVGVCEEEHEMCCLILPLVHLFTLMLMLMLMVCDVCDLSSFQMHLDHERVTETARLLTLAGVTGILLTRQVNLKENFFVI